MLALHWRLSPFAWMTHCLFEPGRFDEVRLESGWAFARVEGAYVAIWAHGGLRLGAGGLGQRGARVAVARCLGRGRRSPALDRQFRLRCHRYSLPVLLPERSW